MSGAKALNQDENKKYQKENASNSKYKELFQFKKTKLNDSLKSEPFYLNFAADPSEIEKYFNVVFCFIIKKSFFLCHIEIIKFFF